jgi:hypothetical protein
MVFFFNPQSSPPAKFSGATGGLNAHVVAFPKLDWLAFADKFVAGLGMKRLQVRTRVLSVASLVLACNACNVCNVCNACNACVRACVQSIQR